jgi:hypothetical protein
MAPQLLLVLHQTGCVSPASSASDSPADLWQHYGNSRARDEARRGVSGAVQWDWYQRMGPGLELLGDVSGRVVADLGAGSRPRPPISLNCAARLGRCCIRVRDPKRR